jgi:hypothetical protein
MVNALLSLHKDAAIFDGFWNLIGGYSYVAIGLQLLSSVFIFLGLGNNNKKLESAGLAWCSTVFALRAITFLTTGDITPSSLNAAIIAVCIIISSAIRIHYIWVANNEIPKKITIELT